MASARPLRSRKIFDALESYFRVCQAFSARSTIDSRNGVGEKREDALARRSTCDYDRAFLSKRIEGGGSA